MDWKEFIQAYSWLCVCSAKDKNDRIIAEKITLYCWSNSMDLEGSEGQP